MITHLHPGTITLIAMGIVCAVCALALWCVLRAGNDGEGE